MLLRALTGGHARSTVAWYTFRMLNPAVRVAEGGWSLVGAGGEDGIAVYKETSVDLLCEIYTHGCSRNLNYKWGPHELST
jgi:hypothetical protein